MSTNPAPEAWMSRVLAILAKAEATTNPHEAEAFLAKAQELMARHAIDDAMLSAAGRTASDVPGSEVILIEPPYASAKSTLLATVAAANRCKAVRRSEGSGRQENIVVGHESDLAAVRTLFGALSVHAVRTMVAEPIPPFDTARRFRHAFLLAFSGRIGERLRAATATAEHQVRETASGAGMAVVLADRAAAVDRAFREQFPSVRTTRSQASSHAGIRSGRAAADRAALGQAGLGGAGRALTAGRARDAGSRRSA